MNERKTDSGHNLPEFTVSEISQALKRTVEESFSFVRVRGEISGFKRAASGHLYMALKDDNAVMDGVCWRGTAGRLGLNPEDGMEVIVQGRLTTYPGRSKYQIVIESMELAGEGALLKLLEDRKRKLAAEGLFDAERKKDIPFLPKVIGVVTSPTGAVIRDILHRLNDRFPRHVLMWPVLVQGDGAAEQVAAAIEGFNRLEAGGVVPRPDVLIVARGGGSLEDLWAFNEEVVVRAAAASQIPLISAVGHETDTTLIDYASDRRAPTPTAAAEMAVPVRMEVLAQVMDDGARLTAAINRLMDDRAMRLEGMARGLPDPQKTVHEMEQRLDDWSERLVNSRRVFFERKGDDLKAIGSRLRFQPIVETVRFGEQKLQDLTARLGLSGKRRLDDAAQRLENFDRLLESYSHKGVLARGYAVVHGADGVVEKAKGLKTGDELEIEFADGRSPVVVSGGTPTAAPKKPKAKPKDDRQGELL